MTSIIIPAHNEARVIDSTLRALLAGVDRSATEIVVVCNGCTDDTAHCAARYAGVTVLETEVASKVHALNLGDAHVTSFPRFYLDADVIVSQSLIRDMTAALETDAVRAAWPSVRFDTSGAAPCVKAFYYVWTRLPYNVPGRIGVGVYALNPAARGRFAEFPDIISDDGYIRGLFSDSERCIVESCHTTVAAPKTTGSLVKIRTRSRLGVYELRQKQATLYRRHHDTSTFGYALRAMASPRLLGCLPFYLFVNLISRMRAMLQMRSRERLVWERDESTRQCTPC